MVPMRNQSACTQAMFDTTCADHRPTGVLLSVPRLVSRLPASLVNLPNKHYWLSPERKAIALSKLAGFAEWFAAATAALLLGVLELCVRANLTDGLLPTVPFLALVFGYLAFTLLSIVWLYRAFRVPTAARA